VSAPSASEVAAQEQLRKHVVDAVMELPGEFRSVVLLRHYRGLDTRQCALQLGIPESTVRTRLKRGVDRLRARLDEQHGGDRTAWVCGLLPLLNMDTKRTAVVAAVSLGNMALALLPLIAAGLFAWSPWTSALAVPVSSHTANASGVSSSDGPMAQDLGPDHTIVASQDALERAAVIASRAQWRLQGVVHDAASVDRTLAQATVRMWVGPVGRFYPVVGAVHETTCDEFGRFSFPLDSVREFVGDRRDLAVFVSADADGYRPSRRSALSLKSDPSPVAEVAMALEPGIFCKGRIVDVDGVPLADASLLMIVGDTQQRVMTDALGRYVIQSLSCEQHGYDRVLFAVHDAHGISHARHVRVRVDGDTRVADLVIDTPLGILQGHVRTPDGRGVAGVTIQAARSRDQGVTKEDGSFEVDGIRIARFVQVTAGANANSYVTETDANGYFRFCSLRPGRHHVNMQARPSGMHVDVTEATDPVAFTIQEALVEVRAVDADEKEVPLGMFAIYHWSGDDAAQAAQRYALTGPTRALLAEVQRRATLDHGVRLEMAPGSFVVIEMDDELFGASYGSCHLGPGDYHGEAVIRVGAADRRGALRIDARDDAGNALAPVLFKCCQIPGERAVPVRGLQPVVRDAGATAILGDWVVVPEDGVVRGLPVGDLTVEVLAGAQLRDGQVVAAPFLIAVHDVSLANEAMSILKVQAKAGVTVQFELQLPHDLREHEAQLQEAEVFLNAPDGSRNLNRKLEAMDGGPITFVNGRCRVRAARPVPEGLYTTTVWLAPGFRSGAQDLTLHAGMGAIPVALTK
jgi:hypothetical protein